MTTNLALDPQLLERAFEISGQKTKKAAVTLALQEFIAKRWVEENRMSINAFNKEVEGRGVWSDSMRTW
jgi:post-segregation antitoxin (ccd killing protein)